MKSDLAALILAGGVLAFAIGSWAYVAWMEKHRHSCFGTKPMRKKNDNNPRS